VETASVADREPVAAGAKETVARLQVAPLASCSNAAHALDNGVPSAKSPGFVPPTEYTGVVYVTSIGPPLAVSVAVPQEVELPTVVVAQLGTPTTATPGFCPTPDSVALVAVPMARTGAMVAVRVPAALGKKYTSR